MGNHKLNLSYIIPKSWLFNLKPTKKHHRKPPPPLPPSPPRLQPCPPAATTTQSQNYSRKSYYFTRELTPTTTTSPPQPLDPSRKSSTRRRTINTHRAHCRKAEHAPPESSSSATTTITGSSVYGDDDSSSVRAQFSSDNEHEDIVINVDYMSLGGQKNETHLGLKEIKTKENSNGSKLSKEPKKNLNSPGVRLRVNSPRIGRRGMAASGGRRSVSGSGRRSVSAESFAVVKASYDPVRDFRESMEEMIMEKNIRGSKDMEDLLACYLLLNSDEYHDLIIKVFKQIWFDFSKIKQS